MRIPLRRVAFLGLLLIPSWTLADPKDEVEKFGGTWKVLSANLDDVAISEEKRDKVKVVFEGDKVNYIENETDSRSTFTVDDSKKPGTITIMPPRGKKETLSGIYKFEDEKLTLCLSVGERPTEFKAGKKILLLVLEKEKK